MAVIYMCPFCFKKYKKLTVMHFHMWRKHGVKK